MADTQLMSIRTPTLDLIARAFAEAVARGDVESAEGWLATARYASTRETPARPRRWTERVFGPPPAERPAVI
jgi:hypothetical protein